MRIRLRLPKHVTAALLALTRFTIPAHAFRCGTKIVAKDMHEAQARQSLRGADDNAQHQHADRNPWIWIPRVSRLRRMNDSKHRRFRDGSSGAPTLINEGCKITGVISGNGNYQVSGEVDGDCEIEGTLSLARSGRWQGTIKADNVVISGHVEGDIIANGKVEIANSARISGTVTGEAIAVAEGAVVEGIMKTTVQPEPVEFVEKRAKND